MTDDEIQELNELHRFEDRLEEILVVDGVFENKTRALLDQVVKAEVVILDESEETRAIFAQLDLLWGELLEMHKERIGVAKVKALLAGVRKSTA